MTAYYEARTERVAVEDTEGIGGAAGSGEDPAKAPSTRGDTVRAYIALTKPRIIELLLITTVRDGPRDPGEPSRRWEFTAEWFRIAFWTLLCGSLAGSANSINQLPRPRHRPAHEPHPEAAAAGRSSFAPENAVVFGIVLGVISIALHGLLREPRRGGS